jgi:hypothetical protein
MILFSLYALETHVDASFEDSFIEENERINAIREKKPFKVYNNKTSEYFRVTRRIDNQFIEGFLGRDDVPYDFHSDINTGYTYFDYYRQRKNIYFTFDKVSLFQVTEIFQENPLRFVLKRIDSQKAFIKNQAFMIMPFSIPDLDSFYKSHIHSFLKLKLQIEIYRADDFNDNDTIIETIHRMIEESEFIIADTTIANKNVFYEIGYASAMMKEIITIQDFSTEQKLFFDRSHIRAINYTLKEIEKFQFELQETIKSIRARY